MKNILDIVLDKNSIRTRWFKCRICGDQFAYRRLLEAHKKLSACKGGDQ